MSQLRDFLYLDTAKLHTFISQIHGGLVSEINETIKKQGGLSAGIEVIIPSLVSGNVGASKEKGNERQQTIQLTDPAYFGALYQYLQNESEIMSISTLAMEERSTLFEGQFVEITGIAEPPTVEYWISRVKSLFDFIDKNLKLFTQTQPRSKQRNSQGFSRKQMELFKGMIEFLEDYIQISRKDPGKQYIRLTNQGSKYDLWCGLIPEFVTAPLEATLPVKVQLVGRVERLLVEEETYKIVDLSQFNQPTDVNKLLEALNGLGPLIGQKAINETDLQAKYPDVFITPIAIYR